MSSGLEMNKIAASILLAGLIAMIVGTVAEVLYHPEENPEKRGYTIAGAEEADTPGTASAEPEKPVDIMLLLASADAAAGEKSSKKCTSCHDFTKGGPNKVGPNLHGIVGASKAHKGDYAYSDAMKSAGGSWDPQSLSDYIANPKKYIPGNKMAFVGIKKPEERAALIKYLESLK